MGPVKEPGSEPRDLVLRSPDPPNSDLLKSINASDVTVSEKSPEVGAECATLVTPQPLGKILVFLYVSWCSYIWVFVVMHIFAFGIYLDGFVGFS